MKALLVDTQWCFGCHACEIMTQIEGDLDTQQMGIKVAEVGPWPYADEQGCEKWQYDYVPLPTDQLMQIWDGEGQPACATVCQSQCMKFGELEDLVKELNHPKQMLYVLGD